MKKLIKLSLVGSAMMMMSQAHTASDTAQALVEVEAAISITQVQDLDFGTVVQGDAAGTVAPGDATAAQFDVTGQPNASYSITLPADGTVQMVTDTGDTADKQIDVDTFVSDPAEGANGLLDGSGAQQLNVGATHAAISATQVAGSYSDTFTVDVVY